LQRIEESAFAESGLTSLVLPASVEVLCKNCRSLTFAIFESDSKLRKVAADSFAQAPLRRPIESSTGHSGAFFVDY
jgi:hypothetical protein